VGERYDLYMYMKITGWNLREKDDALHGRGGGGCTIGWS
jgi:hypothetical protein